MCVCVYVRGELSNGGNCHLFVFLLPPAKEPPGSQPSPHAQLPHNPHMAMMGPHNQVRQRTTKGLDHSAVVELMFSIHQHL